MSLFQALWTRASAEKNKELIEHLRRYGVIKTKKVAEVMETIDRGIFVSDGNPPYLDSPMPIGFNATISAPHMHATCLELLKDHLKSGMRVLDVGSGEYLVSIEIHHFSNLICNSTSSSCSSKKFHFILFTV